MHQMQHQSGNNQEIMSSWAGHYFLVMQWQVVNLSRQRNRFYFPYCNHDNDNDDDGDDDDDDDDDDNDDDDDGRTTITTEVWLMKKR